MTGDPGSYPWSSNWRHAGRAGEYDWLDIDPRYEGLGHSDSERSARYREFVRGASKTESRVDRETMVTNKSVLFFRNQCATNSHEPG
jgi:hypothetical protein